MHPLRSAKSATPRQVNQYVVFVNVTLHDYGPTYTYLLYNSSAPPDPLRVNVGDQVAWYVRVIDGPAQRVQPYQITFGNASLFGTASLSVPAGGFSPFLHVVSLPGARSKYTLSVAGISPPSDPEVQVDGDTVISTDRVPITYVVNWTAPDGTHPQGVLTYTADGGNSVPFPSSLPVIAGDFVTFQSPGAQPFNVVFVGSDHTVASPFVESPNSNIIPGQTYSGGVESTIKLTVAVNPDVSTSFPFYLVLQNNDSAVSATVALSVSNG
ncbi:MAG: hypothetical protein JO062_03315 [Bryobacterales bacterium]|nr:hypothetical protein [Bryobacterales bacterium]